jgi:hypothetical protein
LNKFIQNILLAVFVIILCGGIFISIMTVHDTLNQQSLLDSEEFQTISVDPVENIIEYRFPGECFFFSDLIHKKQ